MKKFLAVLLAVMLLAGLSVNAFAAGGAKTVVPVITNSPAVGRPTIVKEGTTEGLYLDADRNDLDIQASLKYLRDQDDDFQNTKGAKDVAALAAEKGYDYARIIEICKVKTTIPEVTEGYITIVAPEDFLGIIKMVVTEDADGKKTVDWETVETEDVDNDKGEHWVKFHVHVGEVLAIIVGVQNAEAPTTGEPIPYGFLIAAIILAGGAILFFRKSRKANA